MRIPPTGLQSHLDIILICANNLECYSVYTHEHPNFVVFVPTFGVVAGALPHEGFIFISKMASGMLQRDGPDAIQEGLLETQHMIRAVRAYQEDLYARQHRLWARFLLRRWWSWVYRTSEWWRRCNQRELEREWIYD